MNADQSDHMTEKARSGVRTCWSKVRDTNNTVAGYAERGLSRTGVKGSWTPTACRWVMPVFVGIVLVGVAISGDPQGSFATPSLPGRALEVQIATATPKRNPLPDHLADTLDFMNGGFTNMRVTADEDNSALHLLFDFDAEKWVMHYNGGRGNPPSPLLVRLFDKNGEYITHFTTKEQYIPSALAEKWKGWVPSRTRFLEPTGNELVYSRNVADLTFAQVVEVGWYGDKRSFFSLDNERQTRGRAKLTEPIRRKWAEKKSPLQAKLQELEGREYESMAEDIETKKERQKGMMKGQKVSFTIDGRVTFSGDAAALTEHIAQREVQLTKLRPAYEMYVKVRDELGELEKQEEAELQQVAAANPSLFGDGS